MKKDFILLSSKLLENSSIAGITLYPFVLVKKKYLTDERLINHEAIHIKQQKELLVIPFYVLYLLNYFINLFIYGGKVDDAYRNICFEREAYQNDDNLDYIKTRKPFSFFKHLKK